MVDATMFDCCACTCAGASCTAKSFSVVSLVDGKVVDERGE